VIDSVVVHRRFRQSNSLMPLLSFPQIFRALPEFSGTFLLISAIKTNGRHHSILEEKKL
jgi:hypothetical protein